MGTVTKTLPSYNTTCQGACKRTAPRTNAALDHTHRSLRRSGLTGAMKNTGSLLHEQVKAYQHPC